MSTHWYIGYDGVEYPIEVDDDKPPRKEGSATMETDKYYHVKCITKDERTEYVKRSTWNGVVAFINEDAPFRSWTVQEVRNDKGVLLWYAGRALPGDNTQIRKRGGDTR